MTRAVKHSSTGLPRTSPVWFVAKIKFNGSGVQCAMVQTTSRNTARFTMLLIFFGYVSPCTTPDLAAGCPIQAFVMNRRLMGEKGEEEKREEKKIEEKKKKYCTDPYFGISTAQHIRVEFLKNIKKRQEKKEKARTLEIPQTISISVDSPLTNLLPFSLFTIMPQYA